MTRESLPLLAPDLSPPDLSLLARALGRTLKARHAAGEAPPGHVELLNLLARAAGHRNLQALQALGRPLPRPMPASDEAGAAPPPLLSTHARKALTQFDARGRLARWPHKFSVQRLALWALWTRFDARRIYSEREVNEILKAWHTYGDHATLRRELINHRLMTRKSDCSAYRKLAARPDDEARWFLRAWRQALASAPRAARVQRDPSAAGAG